MREVRVRTNASRTPLSAPLHARRSGRGPLGRTLKSPPRRKRPRAPPRPTGSSRGTMTKRRNPPRLCLANRMSPHPKRPQRLPNPHRPRSRRSRASPAQNRAALLRLQQNRVPTPHRNRRKALTMRLRTATLAPRPRPADRMRGSTRPQKQSQTQTIRLQQMLLTPQTPTEKTLTKDPTVTSSAGGSSATDPPPKTESSDCSRLIDRSGASANWPSGGRLAADDSHAITCAERGGHRPQPRHGCARRACGRARTGDSSAFPTPLRTRGRSARSTSMSRSRTAATARSA